MAAPQWNETHKLKPRGDAEREKLIRERLRLRAEDRARAETDIHGGEQ